MIEIKADVKNRVFDIIEMNANSLLTPGTQLEELKFDGFLDYFVSYTDVGLHIKYQPTYVISQIAFLVGGFATLIHAFATKGRLPWLWFGAVLHGVFVELMSFFTPDVDNYWHSQTPLMLFGRRLPIHIIILYPCFIYQASVAVAKLKLPKWSEPFAVGLGAVLVDIPYDIVSVKFVHWYWHDTDPNIYDRHYWVPWNSYYFHSTFAASFTFWFHFLKQRFCPTNDRWTSSSSTIREFLTTFFAAMLGPVGGVLLFIPIYHPLHDGYKIHSEVTYFIIFTIFLLLIWLGDRNSRTGMKQTTKSNTRWPTYVLLGHLVLHYASFWIIPIVFDPQNEISTGIKEKLGPCDRYVPIQTVSGKVSGWIEFGKIPKSYKTRIELLFKQRLVVRYSLVIIV